MFLELGNEKLNCVYVCVCLSCRAFVVRDQKGWTQEKSRLCVWHWRREQSAHQDVLIKRHDLRQTLLLHTALYSVTNIALTHFRLQGREYLQTHLALASPPFHLWKASLSFKVRLSVCVQPGRVSVSLFHFALSNILEIHFDGPWMYFNAVYLRMFSCIYFSHPVQHCCPHTQIGTQYFLFSSKEMSVDCRCPLFSLLRVLRQAFGCGFQQETDAQCICWQWNPQSFTNVSISLIRSLLV